MATVGAGTSTRRGSDVAVGLMLGVGVAMGARLGVAGGMSSGIDDAMAVRVEGGVFVSCGLAVGCGSALSQAAAAIIRRTNGPPIMPRIETPIRCLK